MFTRWNIGLSDKKAGKKNPSPNRTDFTPKKGCLFFCPILAIIYAMMFDNIFPRRERERQRQRDREREQR